MEDEHRKRVLEQEVYARNLEAAAKDIYAKNTCYLTPETDLENTRVLGHLPFNDGCAFYRVFQPLEYLFDANKIRLFDTTNIISPEEWLGKCPRAYNVMINQRIMTKAHQFLAKTFGWMYFLECDDDFWNVSKLNPHYADIKSKGRKQFVAYSKVVKDAFGVITSTEPLVNRFEAMGAKRVYRVPNGINFDDYQYYLSKQPKPMEHEGRIRILWAGSKHHVDDLQILHNVVPYIKQKYNNVDFIFVGFCPKELKEYVEFIEPVENTEFAKLICSLNIDIGLAPLVNSKFNRSKSNVKWLEYTAIRAATIASNVGPYKEITTGITGILCDCKQDWIYALELLIRSSDRRNLITSAAMGRNVPLYDIFVTSKVLATALDDCIEEQKKSPIPIEERVASSIKQYYDLCYEDYNKHKLKS